MAEQVAFDPAGYKQDVRVEWRVAAAGWRKWYSTVEAESAGTVMSKALVERSRVRPGDRVLDVASGYGEPGLTAARAVSPGGGVVCCDISREMLDFARERALDADLTNVEFIEGDVEELDFGDAIFDSVISRAGIMYLVDVIGTLRRLRSLLRPGGRLAAAVWSAPGRVGFAAPVPIIVETLGLAPPPAGVPGPFVLGDLQLLASVAVGAGFTDVETGTLNVVYELDSAEACTQWLRDVAPPIAGMVAGSSPELQQRTWERVTEAWKPFAALDGRIRLDNEALWVAATNPLKVRE